MPHAALDCDVIVVGAGPMGLTSALLLNQYGHKVQLIERHPTQYKQPRAVGLFHQAARMFNALGLHDDLLKSGALQSIRGQVEDMAIMVDSDGELLSQWHMNGPTSKSGMEFSFAIHQPTLESALEAACTARGVLIRRGIEVLHVDDTGDHVEVKSHKTSDTAGNDAVDTTTALFCVGCDGANSVVRKSAGIKVHPVQGANSRWLVMDIIPKTPGAGARWKDGKQSRHYLDPQRPRTAVPSPATRRRWECMVLPNETMEEAGTDEFVWNHLKIYDCTPETAIIERIAVYQLKATWSEAFAKGRIGMAGDSCHTAPQFLGQGLNSGLRDAMGLCWRIDFGIKHPDQNWRALMEDYSNEQLGTTKVFVTAASELEKIFTITDPTAARERDKVLRASPDHHPDLETLGSPGMYLRDPNTEYPRSSGPGSFFMQDKVELDGKSGYFDAVVGTGWVLLGKGPKSPLEYLSLETRDQYKDVLSGLSTYFGKDGCIDLSGRYMEWFNESGAEAALVRPDFYLYGSVKTTGEIEGLVTTALNHLT